MQNSLDVCSTPRISPCAAHIDLACIQNNYKYLCAQLPAGSEGMAIVKSDAYGHGLLPVAKALHQCEAPSFGVGCMDEALCLRKAGFTQDIIVLLGALQDEEMRLAVQEDCTPLVYDMQGLQRAAAFASSAKPAKVGLKLETGMARLGFKKHELPHALDFLRNNPHIQVPLVFSHLACADMPEKEVFVHEQHRLFTDMCASVQHVFPSVQRSLCNSAGSMAYGNIGGHVFRLGIALYGGNPFKGTSLASLGAALKEGMRVSAPVLHAFDLQAGQSVGYGATYVAEKDMRVVVLGMGYADGLSRGLSSQNNAPKAQFMLHNQAAPICGRVCMGMVMVDVSHLQDVQVGQRAWLTTGENPFTIQNLADAWGTITYEVMCLLGKNERMYAGCE